MEKEKSMEKEKQHRSTVVIMDLLVDQCCFSFSKLKLTVFSNYQHIKYKLYSNNCNTSQQAGFPSRLLKQVKQHKNF